MYWEYTYILFIIGVVVSGIASWNVNRTFRNFSKFPNGKGLVAEEVAALIMQKAGIFDVRIERVKGSLTDHYSAKDNVLRLSDSVFGSTSVAAIGVAAHESGHAIQHKVGYLPLKLRSASVPVANFGTMVSWPIILVGLIFGWMGIAQIGVFLFFFVVLFQIITLPVEFNASSRALQVLGESKILIDGELEGAAKVLRAAALTYVAALFTSILQLLRLILITKGSSRMR
ncbi:MAG: zinc metallopeptidase [Oscillospiraceae bacterium]|nr:zinc metallopeptidase [Oscillospiraceae bacterium]